MSLKPLAQFAVACVAAMAPVAVSATNVAFYAPWDPRAEISLRGHDQQIDVLAPAWISVVGSDDNVLTTSPAAAQALLGELRRRPTLLPVVQNARDGVWRGADAAALLANPGRRTALLRKLESDIAAYGGSGIVFDLEDLPSSAQANYLALLAEAHDRFSRHHWAVAVSVPAGDLDWNLSAYGRAADLVILMAYDEHWQTGSPGPIASRAWFASVIKQAAAGVPPDKLVVGLASYGYDWRVGGPAKPIAVREARALASAAQVAPARDPRAGEQRFDYDRRGVRHQVWFVDAQESRAQANMARGLGLKTFAIWRLGTEDPAIWRWFGSTP